MDLAYWTASIGDARCHHRTRPVANGACAACATDWGAPLAHEQADQARDATPSGAQRLRDDHPTAATRSGRGSPSVSCKLQRCSLPGAAGSLVKRLGSNPRFPGRMLIGPARCSRGHGAPRFLSAPQYISPTPFVFGPQCVPSTPCRPPWQQTPQARSSLREAVERAKQAFGPVVGVHAALGTTLLVTAHRLTSLFF